MERGSDSVPIVVEEEKRGNSASMQAVCFLGGAMPVAPPMPFRKGCMAHNSRFWRPGEEQHPSLSTLFPWEHTHRGGGFSLMLFSTLLHFLKSWIGYPCLCNSK